MNFPNDTKRANSNSGSMGQFNRSRAKLIHLSAVAKMIPNPLAKNVAAAPLIPYIQKPGITFKYPNGRAVSRASFLRRQSKRAARLVA